jgi:hypothetical protein
VPQKRSGKVPDMLESTLSMRLVEKRQINSQKIRHEDETRGSMLTKDHDEVQSKSSLSSRLFFVFFVSALLIFCFCHQSG